MADFDDAYYAYEKGDYETALLKLRPLIKQEHVGAHFLLGSMYHVGEGVSQNFQKAVKLYKIAAEKGNNAAQFFLGNMYSLGLGIQQDYVLAYTWYSISLSNGLEEAEAKLNEITPEMTSDQIAEAKVSAESMQPAEDVVFLDREEAIGHLHTAANQGNATAQTTLGIMYERGQNFSQDYNEAVKWYRLAAGQNHADAQYNLGVMYANGFGVPRDYVRAHVWVSFASYQGHEEASIARRLLETKMTDDQEGEAHIIRSKYFSNNYKEYE